MKKLISNLFILSILAVLFTSCQKEPVAMFTVSSEAVLIDETVYFTNTSIDAYSYLWDLGDGITTIAENPSHSYSRAGTYSVSLTAYSKNGKVSDFESTAITVAEGGDAMFWTSEPVCPVTVNLLGKSKQITDYYLFLYPSDCGATGCATFWDVPAGTYDFTATDELNHRWEGLITVIPNGCSKMQLTLSKAITVE